MCAGGENTVLPTSTPRISATSLFTFAAGKIPGGFFKREGRPHEHETLTSRFIDRPIRPLFPKGFHHEMLFVLEPRAMYPQKIEDQKNYQENPGFFIPLPKISFGSTKFIKTRL